MRRKLLNVNQFSYTNTPNTNKANCSTAGSCSKRATRGSENDAPSLCPCCGLIGVMVPMRKRMKHRRGEWNTPREQRWLFCSFFVVLAAVGGVAGSPPRKKNSKRTSITALPFFGRLWSARPEFQRVDTTVNYCEQCSLVDGPRDQWPSNDPARNELWCFAVALVSL